MLLKILDAESETDSTIGEDNREKEKKLFNVLFSADTDSITTQSSALKKVSSLVDINEEKKENKYKLVKLNVMRQIALFINPLIYVIFSVVYFVYYLNFFS